jgi:predicted unusual protein kinase regulating ubiquinone biosynthesis (AarF/ABC1/UbiB family)
MASERRITASRLGRLGQLGRLAGGIAGGMVSEGARQLSNGRRPTFGDLLLTPANARRVAERLSEMRGAAMKVGQLLSMDGGQLLPPQLSEVLSRLREDAHQMPLGQVAQALRLAWGDGWESRFQRFNFTPIASASIGQVHRAELRDGRELAIKVQYPGIRRSIDSDVDNVATLLRLINLVPQGVDFAPVLAEAKQQLHAEADYQQEAAALTGFARLLEDDTRFVVPAVIEGLTSSDVLAMAYLDGQPIESVADAPAALRNQVAGTLLELAMREVFEWGLVQTDPNFANYLYAPKSGQIQLLDFGATRAYPPQQRRALHALLLACADGEDTDVARAARAVGYLKDDDAPGYSASIVKLLRTATEPVRDQRPFPFRNTDLAQRMSEVVIDMRVREKFGRLPPTEVLFLHRKLGGLYLLLSRLAATLPVRTLLAPHLDERSGDAASVAHAAG